MIQCKWGWKKPASCFILLKNGLRRLHMVKTHTKYIGTEPLEIVITWIWPWQDFDHFYQATHHSFYIAGLLFPFTIISHTMSIISGNAMYIADFPNPVGKAANTCFPSLSSEIERFCSAFKQIPCFSFSCVNALSSSIAAEQCDCRLLMSRQNG